MSGLNGNGHHQRLWALALLALTVLLGVCGWLVSREFDRLEARMDRVTDYVLERQKP